MENAVRPQQNAPIGIQTGMGEGGTLPFPFKSVEKSRANESLDGQATKSNEQGGMHFAVRRLSECMDTGPDSDEAQSAVQALRKHVCDNFFNCTVEAFRALGELYVEDARFTSFFEKYHSGLAQFVKEAIDIYCDKVSRDGE